MYQALRWGCYIHNRMHVDVEFLKIMLVYSTAMGRKANDSPVAFNYFV